MSEPVVASVQDVLGAAGEPPSFVWRGRRFKVGHPTPAVEARFEELIAEAEVQAVRSLRGLVPDDDYREEIRRLGRQTRDREYRTGKGSLWVRYTVGDQAAVGANLYLLALLREHHPDFSADDLRDALEEEQDFLLLAAERVIPGFFGWAGAKLKLPPGAVGTLVESVRARVRAHLAALKGTTP